MRAQSDKTLYYNIIIVLLSTLMRNNEDAEQI
jgi:hypothetical protein